MRPDSSPHGGHGQPDPGFDPNARYEKRDVSIATLLPWFFGLFVFAGTAAVITYGFMYLYVDDLHHKLATPPPVEQARREAAPEEPRLQANPVVDIIEFRRSEQFAAENYGQDPATHAIHMPIQRMIDLLYPVHETGDTARLRQEVLPTRANPGTQDVQEPNQPSQTQGQAESRPMLPADNVGSQQPAGTALPSGTQGTMQATPSDPAEPEGIYPATSGRNDKLPY